MTHYYEIYLENYLCLVSTIGLLENDWVHNSLFCNPTFLQDMVSNAILPPDKYHLAFYLLSHILTNEHIEDIYIQRLIYLLYVRNWIYGPISFYQWYRENQPSPCTFFCHDFFRYNVWNKTIEIENIVEKKKQVNDDVMHYWKRRNAAKIIDNFLFEKFIPHIYHPDHPFCRKMIEKELAFVSSDIKK